MVSQGTREGLFSIVIVFVVALLAAVKGACPTDSLKFPQLETVPSLEQLHGVWLDELSSREADTHFYCTQQSNAALNRTSYRTDTTSSMAEGKVPYRAAFINNMHPSKGRELVFDLVPDSQTAHWFAGSLFFLVDFVEEKYYSWMICNDSDEYEFHISAREGTDLSGVADKVLGILDDYHLNPQGQTFHEEPHNSDVCQACLSKGEVCFRGDQCCSDRCTSWNNVRWTCA